MEQPQSPVATDIGASASQEKGGESAFICSCHLLHILHFDDIHVHVLQTHACRTSVLHIWIVCYVPAGLLQLA